MPHVPAAPQENEAVAGDSSPRRSQPENSEELARFTFSPSLMRDVLTMAEELGVPPAAVLQRAVGLLKYAVALKRRDGRLLAKAGGKLVEVHV